MNYEDTEEYKQLTKRVLANTRSKARYWGVESTLTLKELREIFLKGHCFYCDSEMPLENRALSYIIPMHEGGINALENVLIACKPCVKKIGWNSVFYRSDD